MSKVEGGVVQKTASFLKSLFALPEHVLQPYREAAMAELQSLRIESSRDGITLDGSVVEVLDQSETVQHEEGRVEAFYLTQIVRTATGHYFLLKTTDRSPYVKSLSQAWAKHLLGSRYRLPGA